MLVSVSDFRLTDGFSGETTGSRSFKKHRICEA